MIEKYGHSRLESRHVLRGELVCDTAVHVGTSGATDVLATTDMPVARDGAGRPYIPGSSFRGSFRSGLESLLRGLDGRPAGLPVCDPLQRPLGGRGGAPQSAAAAGDGEKSCANRILELRQKEPQLSEEAAFRFAWDDSCEICRLFGNSFLASRVWIGDLRLLSDSGENSTYLRDGVGLDRDLRSVAQAVLYNFEAVAAGARFELRLEVENAADHELGLILTGLSLFENGFLGIGGKRARGLGMAKVEGSTLVRFSAADFFDQTGGREIATEELDGFRRSARTHYLEGQN